MYAHICCEKQHCTCAESTSIPKHICKDTVINMSHDCMGTLKHCACTMCWSHYVYVHRAFKFSHQSNLDISMKTTANNYVVVVY